MTNILDDLPAGEPIALVAGDAWRWKRRDLATEFPAAAYTLSYALRPIAGGAVTTIALTASGSDWIASRSSTDTAGMAAGDYSWTLFATRTADNERQSIGAATLKVLPNLATDTADRRTHQEKVLAALEALLEGRAGKDVESYTIGDRQLTKMSVEELLKWRDRYRAEVRAQRARANGKTARRRSLISFGGN